MPSVDGLLDQLSIVLGNLLCRGPSRHKVVRLRVRKMAGKISLVVLRSNVDFGGSALFVLDLRGDLVDIVISLVAFFV